MVCLLSFRQQGLTYGVNTMSIADVVPVAIRLIAEVFVYVYEHPLALVAVWKAVKAILP